MLEESEEHQDKSGDIFKFHNNDFYAAIRDEDLGRIEEMSRKHGSNSLIKISDRMPGDVLCKGLYILPLHLAASYRRLKSMRSLLSAGADPELRDALGRTTLHLIITSWPNILTALPKQSASCTHKRTQAEACLRLLCEHGVNINAEVEGSHQTALHLSVRYAALCAIQILAGYGADVNALDSSGMTPLHMAAGILHKDIIASLIKEGADINMGVKYSGNTPLHLAAVAMAMRTTKTLADGSGCISELIEHGAEVNAANKAGLTPLQEACIMGNEELVDLLLRYGANINKLSRAGENCLFLFLSHKMNAMNSSLLVKLFSLTSPLTLYNRRGRLPSILTLPCYFKQRDQLLRLVQQPRRLQDICKSTVYLQHVQDKKDKLRKILPDRVYEFVFNYWESLHISFVTDGEQDLFNYSSDIAPF